MLDIQKMLTVSTSHICERTYNLLKVEPNENNLCLSVYEKADFGFYIPITNQIEMEHLPEDLKRLIQLTKDLNCDVLCLDCDAEIIRYLPTYDE